MCCFTYNPNINVLHSASISNKQYSLSLKFFGKVDSTVRPEKGYYVKVLGTEIVIVLPKLEPLEVWPRLLEDEVKVTICFAV